MDIGNDKVEGAKLKNEELSKPICMNEQKMPLNIPVDNMVSNYVILVLLFNILFCKSSQSFNLMPFTILLILVCFS